MNVYFFTAASITEAFIFRSAVMRSKQLEQCGITLTTGDKLGHVIVEIRTSLYKVDLLKILDGLAISKEIYKTLKQLIHIDKTIIEVPYTDSRTIVYRLQTDGCLYSGSMVLSKDNVVTLFAETPLSKEHTDMLHSVAKVHFYTQFEFKTEIKNPQAL